MKKIDRIKEYTRFLYPLTYGKIKITLHIGIIQWH